MKIWFARKQNGDVIELTEKEALTHFEDNNVSRRMRLQFIGTSSGEHYKKAKQEIQALVTEKMRELNPNQGGLDNEERNVLQADARSALFDEIKEKNNAAYEAELAEAKETGVQQPDKTLRIVTMSERGSNASQAERQKIINELQGRL